MIKKFILTTLIVLTFLLGCYFLQPIKKGKGSDATIQYELVENWPDLPADLRLGNPTGIDLDTNQNIIVFHRAERAWPLLGAMPQTPIQGKTILIIDKESGELLNSWGENLFIMPHGLKVDHENNIWVTDVGLHQVLKFSYDGKLLMRIGDAGIKGNDRTHFDKPTDIVINRDGSFYVSDGYGNSRIVKYSAKGEYIMEWGRKGDKQGEFNIPHGITLDEQENIYVADRENSRIQMFDANGQFLKQVSDDSFGAICAVHFDSAQKKLFAVDDFTFLKLKHRGSDVLSIDKTGQIQTHFGRSGQYNGSTTWYHCLTLDKADNIYVGDILGNRLQKFKKVSR